MTFSPSSSCSSNLDTPSDSHMDVCDISRICRKSPCVQNCQTFPDFFKGSAIANHVRTRRLWRDRDSYYNINDAYNLEGQTTSLKRVIKVGLQRLQLKARMGRGRKRAAWGGALHSDLRGEFHRLQTL